MKSDTCLFNLDKDITKVIDKLVAIKGELVEHKSDFNCEKNCEELANKLDKIIDELCEIEVLDITDIMYDEYVSTLNK